MKTPRWPFLLLLTTTLLAQTPPAPNYPQLRAARARELTAPFGWFSLVALQFLKPGLTTVGSAHGNTLVLPGAPPHLLTAQQTNGTITLLAADPSLRLHGRPPHLPATLTEGEEDADALASGTLRLWVINRSGQRFLRIKNSAAPARLHAHPLRWYPPIPSLRITARYTPFPTPHTLTTHNEIGQTYTTPVPGFVEFTLNGTTQKLLPFDSSGPQFMFVFRDNTFRTTTYGGGRFLDADLPSHGLTQPGTVILDFNLATNPPCAYNQFATCPLASPENRLPVPIPAGEKRYHD